MLGTLRGPGSLGALVVLAVACGGSPQPIEGHAYWQTGCDMNGPDGMISPGGTCLSENNTVSGDMTSSQVIIDCTLGQIPMGTNIIIVVASGSGSFDNSDEGLSINANVMGSGMEAYGGYISVQGNGWQVPAVAIGPSTGCHVYIDNLTATGVTGRIQCDELADTEVPPKYRYISGIPGTTASMNFGEFVLANCNNGSSS